VLRAALKANPSLVSPNQHEAESVVGFDFIEEGDFPLGLTRLVELGAANACITSPEGLSYLSTENGTVSARSPDSSLVCCTVTSRRPKPFASPQGAQPPTPRPSAQDSSRRAGPKSWPTPCRSRSPQ
jgi:hypothetical protein